jgi:hypothetical protein
MALFATYRVTVPLAYSQDKVGLLCSTYPEIVFGCTLFGYPSDLFVDILPTYIDLPKRLLELAM